MVLPVLLNRCLQYDHGLRTSPLTILDVFDVSFVKQDTGSDFGYRSCSRVPRVRHAAGVPIDPAARLDR